MILLPKDWVDHVIVRRLMGLSVKERTWLWILIAKNDHDQYWAFEQSLVTSADGTTLWDDIHEAMISMSYALQEGAKKQNPTNGIYGLHGKQAKAKDQNWTFIEDENLTPLKDFIFDRLKETVTLRLKG